MIDPPRIADAQSLLARHFGPTRIARAASLSSPGHDVFLKIETDLPTGSFKVRGAVYALSRHPGVAEVVCASTGNHGAAVAYAAQQLGVRATIFLPAGPNPVKTARILALGARIVTTPGDLTASIDAAQAHADRTGAFFLNDASDPDVPVGTATIGAEIVEQVPDVGAIYVPMGDTALVRGVASAARRHRASIRIVGVVAAAADAYLRSWKTGEVVENATCETIADGLAVRRPLAANVAAIRELVDEVVAVSERGMLDAIVWLHDREQIVAEPAGAAATAAFLGGSTAAFVGGSKRTRPTPTSTGDEGVGRVVLDPASTATVLLVTGCNIAPGLVV